MIVVEIVPKLLEQFIIYCWEVVNEYIQLHIDEYRIYPEHVLAYQDQDVLMENLDMRDSMNELKRDRGGQFATKKFDDEFS